MQIVRDLAALEEALATLRTDGGTIAFVPTMGALHAGHMALVAEGRRRARHVVASIFVNPTQFGPNEDLARYPRREASDAQMLDAEGAALLWAPEFAAMYPNGPEIDVRAGNLETEIVAVTEYFAFAGVGEDNELVRKFAADRPAFGNHRNRAQPHARERAQVSDEHPIVCVLGALEIEIERIGILHQELAPAH